MMIAGGRSVEGNRRPGEDGSAQPQHQPQGHGTGKLLD
jgi:protocatechuate 4,5-dioxygenase, alpha chain